MCSNYEIPTRQALALLDVNEDQLDENYFSWDGLLEVGQPFVGRLKIKQNNV